MTQTGADGKHNLEQKTVLVVKGGTALTETFDVATTKLIRKLDVGENLELLDAEKRVDKDKMMTRVNVKALSDGRTGWATMLGNKGSVYLEEQSMYVVTAGAGLALHTAFSSSSQTVRTLNNGESFVPTDAPRQESRGAESWVRGAVLGKQDQGWLVMSERTTQKWVPSHRCVSATPLLDDSTEQQELRALDVGETVEILEPATLRGGQQLVRVRANKDGKVGFVNFDETFLQTVGA